MNPLLAIGLLIVVAGVFADAFTGGNTKTKVVKIAAKPKKEESAPGKKEETPAPKDD